MDFMVYAWLEGIGDGYVTQVSVEDNGSSSCLDLKGQAERLALARIRQHGGRDSFQYVEAVIMKDGRSVGMPEWYSRMSRQAESFNRV